MQAGRKEAMQGGKQACMQGGKQEGRHAGRQEGRQAGRQAGRKEESRQAGTKVYVRTSTATDPYFVPVLLVLYSLCWLYRTVRAIAGRGRQGVWRLATLLLVQYEYEYCTRVPYEQQVSYGTGLSRTDIRTHGHTDATLITPEQTKFVKSKSNLPTAVQTL